MNLITDRTQQDVLLKTPKGQYGPEDLNRVEETVGELAEMAEAMGIRYRPEIKTDWGSPGLFSPEQWPTQEQMDRYLRNVYDLCRAVSAKADLPETMERLTWKGANQIEQALSEMHTRIKAIVHSLRYSGEFFAGEEN